MRDFHALSARAAVLSGVFLSTGAWLIGGTVPLSSLNFGWINSLRWSGCSSSSRETPLTLPDRISGREVLLTKTPKRETSADGFREAGASRTSASGNGELSAIGPAPVVPTRRTLVALAPVVPTRRALVAPAPVVPTRQAPVAPARRAPCYQ